MWWWYTIYSDLAHNIYTNTWSVGIKQFTMCTYIKLLVISRHRKDAKEAIYTLRSDHQACFSLITTFFNFDGHNSRLYGIKRFYTLTPQLSMHVLVCHSLVHVKISKCNYKLWVCGMWLGITESTFWCTNWYDYKCQSCTINAYTGIPNTIHLNSENFLGYSAA